MGASESYCAIYRKTVCPMLKGECVHSHTILYRRGWLALPGAVYIHAHEDGWDEHDHERLVKVEAVLAKAEQERLRYG